MPAPFKCLLASALAVSVVNGHGYMTDPKVKFTAQAGDPTQFIGSIQASDSGFSGTFNGAPKDNVAAFTKAFKSSKYKSLKEYVTDKAKIIVSGATLTCGSCDPKQEPQPMPKSTVEWSHSDSEGFTPSHEGPCEVWCDDVRTFQDDDCAAHYTMVPAEMPFDRDACMGASTLTFYWMAMHSSSWQVYVNCAPLAKTTSTGAKSKYDTTAPSSPSPTNAPSPTDAPSAPSPTDAPSTPSITTAPTTDESDCGSYDVAGSDSDCGSYDVAGGGSESDCGSYDVMGSESDCGSLDVAGSGDVNQGAGSQTNFDFSTMQARLTLARWRRTSR
ncbi:Calcineurin-binding protein cabin-1 [Phytophthora nicotianae]|uniref:Calcineurin-binding protein cabin-1 n=1 Tax=Phytophthora nicotianae TaxID=4792 RepID=A0A0W8CRT6_PHYNI|nr:Calcineurin-binding protein cabin-1 [Phytophthora nicotianae]